METTVFPDQKYELLAYRAELARHIEDPLRKALCELLWHGTRQFQRMIERDGPKHYQAILAQIKSHCDGLARDVELLAKGEAHLEATADKLRLGGRRLAASRDQYRDHTGRLQWVTHDAAVAKKLQMAHSDHQLAQRAAAMVARNREQLQTYLQAEARLRSALLMFDERALARQDLPPPPPPAPPVVNVTVEPTPVTLEAQINMPPAEISVSLPPRRTVGTIERDRAGNIVRTEQLEEDA